MSQIPDVPDIAGAPRAADPASARARPAGGLGVWEWDVARGELFVDEAARALHGLSFDAPVTADALLACVHAADREAVSAAVRACVDPAVRGPCDVTYRVVASDGSERWIHAAGRVVWEGEGARAARVTGAVRDDTRAAERALAERDERLRAALYASGTGTFRWDISTGALEWDENLDRLFGLAPEKTVRSLDAFIATLHPDDRARVAAACARCAAEGADFDEEFRVVWPDGTVRWLDDKGRTFRGGDGAPAYMTGACVDVTERKRAADALRASEGRLRRILDSGIVGAFFWRVEGGITEANDAFLQLLGYTRDDLRAGRIDWRALTPPAWRDEDERKVAELLATGRHDAYEKEYLAADGGAVPVLIASAFFEGSQTEGVALCQDRTAQRRAEDALRAREGELREALAGTERARAAAEEAAEHLYRQQAVAAALASTLREGEIAEALIAQAVPLLGASAALVLRVDGAELACVDYAGYRDEDMAAWRRYPVALGTPAGDVAVTGAPVFLEDGTAWRARYPQWAGWVAAHGFKGSAALPLRAGGRTAGVLVLSFVGPRAFSARDRETLMGMAAMAAQAFERARLFREAVEARAEAEEARARAEAADGAKSAFLAAMSHELRTPLNAIGGYVDLLEMGIRGPVTEAQMADLARIRRSTRHLLGLIDEVLGFARLGAGALVFDVREVPLASLLADAEVMVGPQSASRGLRLSIQPCVPEVRVRADAEKVQQILLNLLGNAIKFTPEGGEVEAWCTAEGGRVRVAVRDTGVGIAPEKLAQVFEPFVQVDRHFSPTMGVGLGLAISRELARAMGGELWAESVPGAGSTFTLELAAVEAGVDEPAAIQIAIV